MVISVEVKKKSQNIFILVSFTSDSDDTFRHKHLPVRSCTSHFAALRQRATSMRAECNSCVSVEYTVLCEDNWGWGTPGLSSPGAGSGAFTGPAGGVMGGASRLTAGRTTVFAYKCFIPFFPPCSPFPSHFYSFFTSMISLPLIFILFCTHHFVSSRPFQFPISLNLIFSIYCCVGYFSALLNC